MTKQPSFTQWLKQQNRRNDPVGDLARDVVADEDWPKYVRSPVQFQDYLESVSASTPAQEALDHALNEYAQACGLPRVPEYWQRYPVEDDDL